jgi:hypothetical protein
MPGRKYIWRTANQLGVSPSSIPTVPLVLKSPVSLMKRHLNGRFASKSGDKAGFNLDQR